MRATVDSTTTKTHPDEEYVATANLAAKPVETPQLKQRPVERKMVLSSAKYNRLVKCGKIVDRMSDFTKKQINLSSSFAKQILGTALAHTGISLYNAEIFTAAVLRAFFQDIAFIKPNLNTSITKSCTPSRASFSEYIDYTAASKLAWLIAKHPRELL
uniref:Uncharacterized protein n=1 Tax=Proboscia inermis TaxID=420281 RepID=A0A7S0GEV0_9STRA|mmetsp:Transcript_32251/g.32535  ORF Transcript_32251/g.32535 Transcript_32251/m.32535 type:complete len:158 (+) Transcript_32251:216-689(+)